MSGSAELKIIPGRRGDSLVPPGERGRKNGRSHPEGPAGNWRKGHVRVSFGRRPSENVKVVGW